jgi:HEAT repeat protein
MNSRRLVWLAIAAGCLMLGGLVVQANAALVDETPLDNLKSSDESVRLQTIDKLGSQGAKVNPAAVVALEESLKDSSAKVRARAAWALGEVGAPAKPVVQAIVELLKDPDENVRRQAVKAVMKIRPGPKVIVPLCTKLLEEADAGIRMRILNAIAEAGPQAVPGLIEALRDDRTADDYWALLVLREMGPAAKDAVPALVEKLRDPRPEIRREAILALAAMDDAAKSAVAPIAVALTDANTAVAATYALGRIGQFPKLGKTFVGTPTKDQGGSETAVPTVRIVDAEVTIRENTKSDDKMLSTTSLWTLARVHPEDKELRREAGERLVERLKDQDPFVRVQAARALAALPPAPEIMGPIWEKAFADADDTTVLHALDAMAALGPPAVPRLIDALKREKARIHVAYILGKLGPAAAPATEALAKLVDDKDERVANEAIVALANIGPGAKDAVPTLTRALQQGESVNAHAIVYALGKIGPDAAEAEPVLTKLLGDSKRCLAIASAWALVHIRPASAEVAAIALPVLMSGLADSTPMVRQCAAEALGGLGPAAKEAIPALQKAKDDEDKSVRAAAAKAIASIRGDAVENK